MQFWLVKTEPSTYSWDDLLRDGSTFWDGVRNFAARNFLKGMKKKDKVFIYHSNIGKEIVGIAEVSRENYPDPKDDQWVIVDLIPSKPLKKPVTLEEIKKTPELKNIGLVKVGRLSVMPLTESEYKKLLQMGGMS